MTAVIASAPWNDPSIYNFASSEFGGVAVKVVLAILLWVFGKWAWGKIRKHFECDVESPVNCEAWGHVVHGTGHRACHDHNVHTESRGAITAEDILRHHEESGA